MGVIVVKPGAVREHEIAFDFLVTQRPVLVDFVISRFVRVLQQRARTESARVAMRILQRIIPLHMRAMLHVGTDQLDRFRDHVHRLRALNRDSVFRLDPKHSLHGVAR